MTAPTPDEIQLQLDDLLAERARLIAAGHDAERVDELTAAIAELSAALGLDPSEVDDLGGHVESPPEGSEHPLHGECRVLRRPGWPILTFCGVVVAGALAGLGEPLGAGLLVVVIALVWIWSSATRVARIRVGPDGRFGLPGRLDPVDFDDVDVVEFAYRYPRATPELRKAAHETIVLRLHIPGRRMVALARGPLWRVRPGRAPMPYYRLERFLLHHVRAAGMTVERSTSGWTARR